MFAFLCFDVAFVLSLISFLMESTRSSPLSQILHQSRKALRQVQKHKEHLERPPVLQLIELLPKTCGFKYLNYIQSRLGLGCLFSCMFSLKLEFKYCPGCKGLSSTLRRDVQDLFPWRRPNQCLLVPYSRHLQEKHNKQIYVGFLGLFFGNLH